MQKSLRSFFAATPAAKRQKTRASAPVLATAANGAGADGETKQSESKSEEVAAQVDDERNTNTDTPAQPLNGLEIEVEWGPFNNLGTEWKRKLAPEYNKPYFQSLIKFLKQERRQYTVFPPDEQLFTAFSLCSFDSVKVVIIGQDPYHGPGQAHGLAFSVQHGIPQPPSLKNMIKEAMSDVGIPKPNHGCLTNWSTQGVLLLNTCLTVRQGAAFSHKNKGWEQFTTAVMKELNKKSEGIVFLAWGSPAEQKCSPIVGPQHSIIKCSHPSPLAAHKTTTPFIGSRCFSRCNAALQQKGHAPIDWTI